jgi:hypothetical protein
MASVTRPSATTSATLLASVPATASDRDDYSTISVVLKNVTGSAAIFLGGDNTVTTGTGFQWDVADGPLSVDLEPGESLYGIVVAVTQVVHVMKAGR